MWQGCDWRQQCIRDSDYILVNSVTIMCYNSRHSSIVINSFVNTFPVNLVSIDWDDQKFESLELLLLLNFGGTSGACGGRGNVLIDSGISKSSAYHVLSGRDDRFQLGVTFAEHKPTANMETLDAGYFADRSSAGSLALSRSKSGHQLPLQRVKSGAPTAEHVAPALGHFTVSLLCPRVWRSKEKEQFLSLVQPPARFLGAVHQLHVL